MGRYTHGHDRRKRRQRQHGRRKGQQDQKQNKEQKWYVEKYIGFTAKNLLDELSLSV